VFGDYRDYVEDFRPNDISPPVGKLALSPQRLVHFINEERLIYGSVVVMEDFEAELSALPRIARSL
jgi:hypothetical protein